jgi:hypothetical protein
MEPIAGSSKLTSRNFTAGTVVNQENPLIQFTCAIHRSISNMNILLTFTENNNKDAGKPEETGGKIE